MFAREGERAAMRSAMSELAFGVVIPEDASTRPIRTAWYAGAWAERSVSATIVETTVRRIAPPIGNRNQTVPCVQLLIEVGLVAPLGCGLSLPLGHTAPNSVAEALGEDHPAAGLPAGTLRTFVRLTQPDESGAPGFMVRGQGKRLRFTDRSVFADYLPDGFHSSAHVLVQHDIPLSHSTTTDDVRRGLNLGCWMAWSLETGRDVPG